MLAAMSATDCLASSLCSPLSTVLAKAVCHDIV